MCLPPPLNTAPWLAGACCVGLPRDNEASSKGHRRKGRLLEADLTVNSRTGSGSGTLAERVRERGWCQPQSFHGRLTIAVSRLTDG